MVACLAKPPLLLFLGAAVHADLIFEHAVDVHGVLAEVDFIDYAINVFLYFFQENKVEWIGIDDLVDRGVKGCLHDLFDEAAINDGRVAHGVGCLPKGLVESVDHCEVVREGPRQKVNVKECCQCILKRHVDFSEVRLVQDLRCKVQPQRDISLNQRAGRETRSFANVSIEKRISWNFKAKIIKPGNVEALRQIITRIESCRYGDIPVSKIKVAQQYIR